MINKLDNLILLIITTLVILMVAACSASESEVSSMGEDFSAHAGTWRLEASYPDKVGLSSSEVSGTTCQIIAQRNFVSDYNSELECNLTVGNCNSDYRSLELPGNEGKFFNPCSLIKRVRSAFLPNGSSQVSGQAPSGGSVSVSYSGNTLVGFKIVGSEIGSVSLSINGSMNTVSSVNANYSENYNNYYEQPFDNQIYGLTSDKKDSLLIEDEANFF